MKLFPYFVLKDGDQYWCGDYEGEPMFGSLIEAFFHSEDQFDLAIKAANRLQCEIKVIYLSQTNSLTDFYNRTGTNL